MWSCPCPCSLSWFVQQVQRGKVHYGLTYIIRTCPWLMASVTSDALLDLKTRNAPSFKRTDRSCVNRIHHCFGVLPLVFRDAFLSLLLFSSLTSFFSMQVAWHSGQSDEGTMSVCHVKYWQLGLRYRFRTCSGGPFTIHQSQMSQAIVSISIL